jgi:hypothetical protein
MLKKLGLISLSAVSAMAMHTFELNINNKDLGVALKLDMGQFSNNVEPGTTFIGAKYLKADVDHSEYTDTLEPFYELNFLKTKSIADSGVSLGLGVKVNYTEQDEATFMSIPLGFEGIYIVPNMKIIPVTINASIYYAPEVLSMEDAHDYFEFGVNVRFEVIENGLIVVGYRNMNTSYKITSSENKSYNYNNSGYVGFKFAF